MSIERSEPNASKFNENLPLPYDLRLADFRLAMQDVYDFFHDVNGYLAEKGLDRLDEMLRPAAMSGILSATLTASLARHARALTVNQWHNGHPDLVRKNQHPDNAVESGNEGVEVKSTRNVGGAVDTHGARNQWMCVFVYSVDNETEPARDRKPNEIHRRIPREGRRCRLPLEFA